MSYCWNLFVQKNTPVRYFVLRWLAGLYSPDQIIPLQTYCQNAASLIWNEVENFSHNGIDIHVSHDILLTALRVGWFGLSPSDNWIKFLGGYAFTILEESIKILDLGKIISVEIPYWWKN